MIETHCPAPAPDIKVIVHIIVLQISLKVVAKVESKPCGLRLYVTWKSLETSMMIDAPHK